MADIFNPGPIEYLDTPIYIAAVSEYNNSLAGELCDGLCMHSFNTPSYTEDVIAPLFEEGADKGGRDLSDVALSAKPFMLTGRDQEEIEIRRKEIR